ncbi:MAG: hypothetical protein V9E99_03780 [Microthrixaceae bacterium]
MDVTVDFCGERLVARPDAPVVIGRDGDITIDDNPYLHRRFLEVAVVDGLCWLSNLGGSLSATLSDEANRVQAWLAPGARLPLVFERSAIRFTAGPTTYELHVELTESLFTSSPWPEATPTSTRVQTHTIGNVPMTDDQRALVVALAEPLLRQNGRGSAAIPSSAQAAARLGWTITKFTRKLDNVCDKLTKAGVRGLHGEPGRLASNRRARLVEYAVSVGLVTVADLESLP